MHLHLPASASRRSASALPSIAKRPGRARPLAGLLASLVLLGSLAAAAFVSASTPVTVGFRDFSYAGDGASRATADKPQSKLWFAGDKWWAGLFVKTASVSDYRIHRLDGTSWVNTGPTLDGRPKSHADYYFDSASNKLYVLSAGEPAPGCVPATDVVTTDDLLLYRYNFNGSAYTLDASFPVVVDKCGSYTATIARDSVGTLWASYPQGLDVKVAHSVSDGLVGTLTDETTWALPYRLPVQVVAKNLNPGAPGVDPDITAVVAFGSNKIGVAWSNHSTSPATISFAVHTDGGADDATAWGTTPETALAAFADDHLNVKTDPDGNVWIVTKTSLDGDPVKTKALIQLLQRSAGGAWTTRLVSTVADLDTRPQLLISDTTPRVAYVLMSAPNGGGSAYYKSAPINSSTPEDFKFATGNATNSMPGVPFISSAVETQIDDVTTTKQNITATTGLVAEGSDRTQKVYLHNSMSIAASDVIDPVGTVSINGAAELTGKQLVSVAVPATDAGSGVSEVRLSNSPGLTAGVLTTGTTFAYTTPVAWTLTAGEGVKTVYAQWRDGAGNWSAVQNDTITLKLGTFVSLTPARLLDTRINTGLTGPFHSGVARTFQVTGLGGVPANAVAVTGNLTVTEQTSAGFVALTPSAINNPTTSTLNFPVGDNRANGVTVALSGTGTLSATYVGAAGPSATTQLIFDVTGYFVSTASGATFVSLTPARLLDTRINTGLTGPFHSGVARTFQVTGLGGVPANAVAVTGNLTVTEQTSAGFVALTPSAINNPTTSTLNFPVGDNRANGVTVALSGTGTLSATYVGAAGPSATTQLIFDVTGYFVSTASGATFVSLTPARLLDTRINTGLTGPFHSGVARTFQVTGLGGVPANAVAVTGNLTVTEQTSAGFVALTPSAISNPTTSTLNFPVGDNRANGVTVALSGTGTLSATYVGAAGPSATTQLIFDVTGYFVP